MAVRGKNQVLVHEALRAAGQPLTAYAILDRLRDKGIRAPLQVYRALEKLTAAGEVHRLDSMNAYLACAQPDCHAGDTVAFAICDRCGQVEEFEDVGLRERLRRHFDSTGFKARRGTIELHGDCAACGGR